MSDRTNFGRAIGRKSHGSRVSSSRSGTATRNHQATRPGGWGSGRV